jgi:membrane-associated protease RseP (regulator of RpoE activity)
MSLQVGPDGVSCEVTENVDGKEQKHTYTAGSVEELIEAHPELHDQLGGTGIRMFGGPGRSLRILPRTLSGLSPKITTGAPELFDENVDANGEPPTDRLGIQCRPVEKVRSTELGLDDGVGLSVEDVVPGTIASLLGLRRGDVVVQVDGATIHGTEDVKKALHDRAANAEVSVVVVGGDGHKRTLNWRPKASDDKAEKADKPESKSGSRKL